MRLKKSLKSLGKFSFGIKSKVLLIILILIGTVYFLRSDFWAIRKISCFNEAGVCPTDVYSDLSSLAIGKHLIFVSTKWLKATIIEHYPFLKKVNITKKIPPGVQFNLFAREPLAAIVRQLQLDKPEASASADQSWLTGNEYFLVDEDGYILRKDKITNLPLILVQDLPSEPVGQQIGQKAILKALEIILGLKLNLFEPEVARINEFNIEFRLKDKVKVIFSIFESAESQINPLQFILNRAKIEGRKIRQIDLRFDKPVVIYD